MEENDMIVVYVAAYMLKVLKNRLNLNKYKDEFNAIKHGDYGKFIKLINEPIGVMVIYDNGKIKVPNDYDEIENDFDFIKLLAAGNSAKKFYLSCVDVYGKPNTIIDNEISFKTYKKLILFELRIRMHAKNKNLNSRNLVDVIYNLRNAYQFTDNEYETLQLGRKNLNILKHDYTPQKFKLNEFELAFEILNKYKIQII